jgi:hypothetical protein
MPSQLRPLTRAPQAPLSVLKQRAKQSLSRQRWKIASGGTTITVGAVTVAIATDEITRTTLTTYAQLARADATFTVAWKGNGGQWRNLTAAQIIAAQKAMCTWVNSCFVREQALAVLIDAAADQTALTAAIATGDKFWP